MRQRLLAFLRRIGKSDKKVAAVFGFDREACQRAVAHLREGAPDVPIWLFTTVAPDSKTVALCHTVVVDRSALALLFSAERQLWPFWVALSLATWTGGHGKWPLKAAPFLIPPFRALVLNSTGDFFAGTPSNVVTHVLRTCRGGIESTWYRITDFSRGLLYFFIALWYCGPVTRIKDLSRGVRDLIGSFFLLVFSTVIKWCGYPDRLLFERLHGTDTLDLPSSPATGSEVAVCTQTGPRWNAAEFERFAQATTARWILWRQDSATDNLQDLPPLFENTGDTFAVSRQSSFRNWKPMLFAAAPFRRLQPDEASKVFAPLASAILVDRLKLLALGIPHTNLPATAWLMLFWKAAAAGCSSYSAGPNESVSIQPDFPVQERAFILRALLDRNMRRLGPRHKDLARGSIAFAPALRRATPPRSGRTRVLVVSPFLPYPLSHGGAVRIYNLCLELRDSIDFTLVAVREKNEHVDYPKLHEIFGEVYVLDKDEHALRDPSLPAQVREHQSRSLRALIADLARRHDLLQIEYTHMAAFRDAAPNIPAILVEHDLTFSLYRQLTKSNPGKESQHEYERWLNFEKRWLGIFDGVWTVSDEDREGAILEGARDPARTFSVPNGVDTERFVPANEPTQVPEIFYVGSFRHLPNILGFEKLRHNVMPGVWAQFPEARLRVVAGPRHEEFWKEFAPKESLADLDQRIVMHGFVSDLRPLYAKASVVVVPLQVSAGTNIKVLEAMACGKAVVSTPVGCAGLGLRDGVDAVVHQDWREFAEAVCFCIVDSDRRAAIAHEARSTVERRYSWKAIAEQALRSYQELI